MLQKKTEEDVVSESFLQFKQDPTKETFKALFCKKWALHPKNMDYPEVVFMQEGYVLLKDMLNELAIEPSQKKEAQTRAIQDFWDEAYQLASTKIESNKEREIFQYNSFDRKYKTLILVAVLTMIILAAATIAATIIFGPFGLVAGLAVSGLVGSLLVKYCENLSNNYVTLKNPEEISKISQKELDEYQAQHQFYKNLISEDFSSSCALADYGKVKTPRQSTALALKSRETAHPQISLQK